MAGQVQTEGVLFAIESFMGGERTNLTLCSDTGRFGHAAEHVVDGQLRIAGRLLRALDGVGQPIQQTRPHRVRVFVVPGEGVHGTRADQGLEDALVRPPRIDPMAEVVDALEGSITLALLDDRLHGAGAESADRTQAIANAVADGAEAEFALVDVRRQDTEFHAPDLVDEGDHLVDVLHVRRQHGGHEVSRVVGLEIRRAEGQQGVAGRMRLGERIACELLHLVENLVGQAVVDVLAPGSFEEHGAHLDHLLGLLLGHGAPQQIRLSQGEPGEKLGHRHHLFLVEHHPVGAGQRSLQDGMRIANRRPAVLAVDVVLHRPGLQRSGPEQCHQGDDVLDGVRLQLGDEFLHAVRLELEDRRGLRPLQELVRIGIVEGQMLDVEGALAGSHAVGVDGRHRPVDDGQRLQAEEVELHEPGFLHVVEIELGHHGPARVVRVQRNEVGQRRRCDDHPRRHACPRCAPCLRAGRPCS